MMTIAWISLGLDLELDGAHVPESRALDEEQDGHQPVVGPGLAESDGEAVDNVNDYLGDDVGTEDDAEGLDDSDAAEYKALGDGSAAEENADLCHGEANKEEDGAGASVEHDDLGNDTAEENGDVLDVGKVAVEAAESDDDSGECNEAVAAVSACEHGDLLHPESAATQVPIPRPMGTEVSWRVQCWMRLQPGL